MSELLAAQRLIPLAARAEGPLRRPASAASGALGGLSDEALMVRVQEDCEASFDALVLRHYHPVVNFAARMTGRGDLAPDIAQHAFTAVYAQRASFRADAPFRAWLYCIVRRECSRVRRRERRHSGSAVDPLGLPGEGSDPYAAAEREEAAGRIVAALSRLPERERAAVIMFHYLQSPYEEIARALGCSPGAARTAACRGRARLRRLLDHEEDR